MDSDQLRVAGMATMIPMFLGVGPVVGWFVCGWVGGLFGRQEAGQLLGLLLGFIAGARESWRMTVRVRDELKAHEKDSKNR